MTTDQIVFLATHELLNRVLKLEPDCMTIDAATGRASFSPLTEEGGFLVSVIEILTGRNGE